MEARKRGKNKKMQMGKHRKHTQKKQVIEHVYPAYVGAIVTRFELEDIGRR